MINKDSGFEPSDSVDLARRLAQGRRPSSGEDSYRFFDGRVYHVHFRTKGCRYGKCLCCDYGASPHCVGKVEVTQIMDEVVSCLPPEAEVLLLGTLGSILDEREFSRDLLDIVLMKAASAPLDTVILETNWDSVGEDAVEWVLSRLDGKQVVFECGLESSDESVREVCCGKSLSGEAVSSAIRVIHKQGALVSANVMLGLPFLSVEERLEDARESLEWAYANGVDEVVVFPVNVKPYTALRALFDKGLYKSVSLWELVALLDGVPTKRLGSTYISWWSNRSSSYNVPDIGPLCCSSCGSALSSLLGAYSREMVGEGRRRLLDRMLGLPACSCDRMPAANVQLPSRGELRRRRAVAADALSDGKLPPLAWVGPRESDADAIKDLLSGSVTVYGCNEKGNRSYSASIGRRVNHNNVTRSQIDAMAGEQEALVLDDPSLRIMFYNPYYAFDGSPLVLERAICLNDRELIGFLADKRSFRSFAEKHVRVPDSLVVSVGECRSRDLGELLPGSARFVVQRGVSSGGLGTFVVDSGEVLPSDAFPDEDEKVLVSRYYGDNVPVNVHAVVYEDAVLMLPASTQIISNVRGRLLYAGCDFESYRDIPLDARAEFERDAARLFEAVRGKGYRGVIGADAIMAEGEWLFLEVNIRFQASSFALSRSLVENGLPSVPELNYEAFSRPVSSIPPESLESLNPRCSMLAYHHSDAPGYDDLLAHIRAAARKDERAELVEDGDGSFTSHEEGAYLFSVFFRRRISSVLGGVLNVSPNILCSPTCLNGLGDDEQRMRFKVALMNQGARVSDAAAAEIASMGGLRQGVNDAIDIELADMVVNIPMHAKFASYSPFLFDWSKEGGFCVRYLDGFEVPASVYPRTGLEGGTFPSGARMADICLLATDRVRLQHHDGCDFMAAGRGCAFCDFPSWRKGFETEDVLAAVDRCLDSDIPFRHFLIGGGTCAEDGGSDAIAVIAAHIRGRSDKPIYAMLPPLVDDKALREMKESGVTEVAFNVELYDRELAKDIMPAKGSIPLGQYYSVLESAVALWGRDGSVRSALVVGLEPRGNVLSCVEELASRGVSPMLSIFRPLEHSGMSDVMPPSNDWLYRVYRDSQAICSRYGLELGPSCRACRNNIVAL